jgi:hypothetical protein
MLTLNHHWPVLTSSANVGSFQKHYGKGSSDREALEAALNAGRHPLEVPIVIGDKEVSWMSLSFENIATKWYIVQELVRVSTKKSCGAL